MKTPVQIYHRQAFALDSDVYPVGSGADEDVWDDTVRWGEPTSVFGWLVNNDQKENDEEGYQILTVGQLELRVPAGTVIGPGDRVTIEGKDYAVIDSSAESTWPEWVRASLDHGD